MNFNPELTTSSAVFMSLFAAFLWGSWFISLKYLGEYPLDGFYVTLFTTSIILVWGVGLLIDGSALLGNLRDVLSIDPSRIWVTLLCGSLYVIGMRISLFVITKIGLSLSQPIQSSVSVLVGTFIAAAVGGMPIGLTPLRLGFAALFLIAAVLLSLWAGNMRSNSNTRSKENINLWYTKKDLIKAVGLTFLASAFTPSYTFAISYGLRSTTHAEGLAVLPFMAMLASGAFIGSMLTSGLNLTREKKWHLVFNAPFAIHKLGIISGLCHYGGNIIHTFATAFLSSAVSWPLGITGGLWTQLWGLVYGEFRGAPRRAYVALFTGILLYLTGGYILTFR